MVLGDILFKMRTLSSRLVSQMDIPPCYADLYAINSIIDFEIIQLIKKLAKIIKSYFSDVNDADAFNTALYAAYYELQNKNNPILKDHLSKIGDVNRFISYYRNACNNPFA